MRVFYREEQNVKKNNSASPSAGKPALVAAEWKKLFNAYIDGDFPPATRGMLYQIHNPLYVHGVLDGKRANGFGNKSKAVAAALPYVAGSMVAATRHAFATGETSFSLTSGAHHACYNHGGGYCTFNFLVLAAIEVHRRAGARRVGIIDCDMHAGNGTKDIIEHCDLGFIRHYSFGYDETRPSRFGMEPYAERSVKTAAQWLGMFTMNVQDIMHECDVVIYNAGADPHVDDPLGGVLTTEEMCERDDIVFHAAQRAHTPVAVSLAGGYQTPISKVIELHNNTYRMAVKREGKR